MKILILLFFLLSYSVFAKTNTWYFAATATNDKGQESDFSNEIFVTTTNSSVLLLAWNSSSGPNVTNYSIYVGGFSRTYTNKLNAGTNLFLTVAGGNIAKTNKLILITGLWSTNLLGTWNTISNWPTIFLTNPSPNYYYKFSIKGANF